MGNLGTLIFMAIAAKTLHKHVQNHTSGSSFLDLVLVVATKHYAERKGEPGVLRRQQHPISLLVQLSALCALQHV